MNVAAIKPSSDGFGPNHAVVGKFGCTTAFSTHVVLLRTVPALAAPLTGNSSAQQACDLAQRRQRRVPRRHISQFGRHGRSLEVEGGEARCFAHPLAATGKQAPNPDWHVAEQRAERRRVSGLLARTRPQARHMRRRSPAIITCVGTISAWISAVSHFASARRRPRSTRKAVSRERSIGAQAGLAAARSRGKKGGRPTALNKDKRDLAGEALPREHDADRQDLLDARHLAADVICLCSIGRDQIHGGVAAGSDPNMMFISCSSLSVRATIWMRDALPRLKCSRLLGRCLI